MNKKILIFNNPKKLFNKYFFVIKGGINVSIRYQLFLGLIKFIIKLLFHPSEIIYFYKTLPKVKSLKQILVNIYAILFFFSFYDYHKNSIFIIGDIYNPINKGLLLSCQLIESISIWVIYQGTGSIEEKLFFDYPRYVGKVFFPFSKESIFYKNLLIKANEDNKNTDFINIDTTLNINYSNKINILAIFQGYNKKRRLYPIYIFELLSILLTIRRIKYLYRINKVTIFLHPRLKYLKLIDFLFFTRGINFSIYDDSSHYKFTYIISYSPTISASLPLSIKNTSNCVSRLGENFSISDIKKTIKILLE